MAMDYSWMVSSDTQSGGLEGIFAVLGSSRDQRDSLARSALKNGSELLQEQRYDSAIKEFKRAAALSPDSIDACLTMGRTYTLMGEKQKAVEAFEQAVRIDTTSVDAHKYLAGAYVAVERYGDAEAQYKTWIGLDGTDTSAQSALGSLYMLMDRFAEAETRFQKVTTMAPLDGDGYYKLGMVYNKQKRYTEALDKFERALSLKPNNAEILAESAYSYIGLGLEDEAKTRSTMLWNMGTTASKRLAAEIDATMFTPKIQYADTAKSTFNPFLSMNAPLSLEDASLATPGASKVFTMVFRFNQDMDIASVQSLVNWSIRRSTGGDGGVYDNGVVLHNDREVNISPLPLAVAYDPDTREATVYFRLTQNAAGDGVIDPLHWVFQFSGKDASGHAIDGRGDEYDGFARKPF
jgi:Flp pilus assembly protein TadD